MFGSPVGDATGKPAPILENKAPWPGPPTFRVTSTFAQHVASGRGPGIDIGNQRCGAPVLAMAAGTVTFVGQLPTAIGMANVVRYRISATEELGAAHLATMTVATGQAVTRGQQIGTLGMTGADACHLHQGYKVNGVEQDWWPLYTQQTGGTLPIIESLQGLPDGASVQIVAGKQYQFFGYAADGSRWSSAWTPATATSAGTEAIVKVTNEPASYFLPKSYDGHVVRPNVYLPTNYVDMAKGELYIPPAPDSTASYNAGVAAAAAKATEAKKP